MPAPGFDHALTLGIFTAAYVALGLGRVPGLRVDRTGVAIVGAAAMVVVAGFPWDDAVRSVDAHTLVLLFGMMIVAGYLRLSGFFGLVTLWAIRRARTPRGLLAAIVVASGVLSAVRTRMGKYVPSTTRLVSSCITWYPSIWGMRRSRTSRSG